METQNLPRVTTALSAFRQMLQLMSFSVYDIFENRMLTFPFPYRVFGAIFHVGCFLGSNSVRKCHIEYG
jgi:hypothetical protein